jgi:hypothetical protein
VYPRVASAGAAGWHVLFATVALRAMDRPGPLDSASLWYGRFDGRRWSDIQHVAVVADAFLQADLGSDLVAVDGLLSFAYSFDRSIRLGSDGPEDHGLVVLQRRGGRWAADTLTTWEAPTYVRLAARPLAEGLTVGIVQASFRDGRAQEPSFFLASYDSVWGSPREFAGDGKRSVTSPIMRYNGSSLFASWVSGAPNRTAIQVESTTLVEGGPPTAPTVIATGRGVENFDAVALSPGRFLWLYRDGDSHTRAEVLLGDDDGVRSLGVVAIPLDNPRPRAVVTSGFRVLAISSRLGMTRTDPPATTYFTLLQLSCRSRK